ncbi:MAG: MarR family winged helix-turn-helix transcriptional regulator [Bacillota bacterium]
MDIDEKVREYADQLDKIRERLLMVYSEYMFKRESKEELTHVQGVLLNFLREKGKVTVSEISDYMEVTMAAVSSLTDRLVKGGLIERERSGDDRRVVYINLTPKGRKAIENHRSKLRRKLEEAFLCMGVNKAEQYIEAQKNFLETLEFLSARERNKEREVSDGKRE